MEELFNELISIVTDRLSDLTDTINIDDIMQSATDAIQSTVEALSNADIDLDEDTKERSEERRVGKECRIGCRSRWSPYH